jgi:peptidylprolyl isomerase
MKRSLSIGLGIGLLLLTPAVWAGQKIPNFRVKQAGGEGKIFQLSDHKGSWVLLDFLLAEPNPADAEHYRVLSASAEQLAASREVVIALFSAAPRERTVGWWSERENPNLPIYQDPEAKLSQALKIPAGLELAEGKTGHYPATMLVGPDGLVYWTRIAKDAQDRASLEEILAVLADAQAQYEEKEKRMEDLTGGNAIETDSGLKYVELKEGTGQSPKTGDRVSVHYTGWLVDGTKFDSSVDRGKPFQFNIGMSEVIAGWDEGVMSMKVGGKRKLIIPSDLGYGARGAGGVIPPNATLVFEVELLGVN